MTSPYVSTLDDRLTDQDLGAGPMTAAEIDAEQVAEYFAARDWLRPSLFAQATDEARAQIKEREAFLHRMRLALDDALDRARRERAAA